MVVTGEAYAAMNLTMNALILSLAARRAGRRLTAGRALTASLAGTLYALAAWTVAPRMRSLPCVLLAGAVMALIAFGRSARAAADVTLSGCLAAGAADFLSRQGVSPLAALSLCALALILTDRAGGRGGARGAAFVAFRGREIRLPVLFDSGNLLTDPTTGRAVAVAPYALLRDILPPLNPNDLTTLPRGFWLLRARTAGGDKTFMCFRPDAFRLREGAVYREKNAVVALSDMREPYALVGDGLMSKGRKEHARFG